MLNGPKKAMGGGVSFREALQQRLDIIKPSQDQLSEFIASHPPKLSPGIKDLVAKLQALDKRVFLVSGGFRDIIAPVAKILNITSDDVYANKMLFNEDGSYKSFDLSEPTSDSGGKPMVVKQVKARHSLTSVVMVGDGATDMEAHPPADAFIGYGGNVIREKVKAGAPWFVTDFQELIDELS